ncbi:hypothetical protein [Streptomyces luteireticuli]|uniref:Uncharacterized protein n=1 Tax=Streptomyces luteireticuli TaxID=173858 RepID=A0ABN0YV63_9ACTN
MPKNPKNSSSSSGDSRRKSWDLLSDGYRKRLERGGITRAAYEQGKSLSRARGHAYTPERPERAAKNTHKYQRYLRARKDIRVVSRDGVVMLDGLTKKERGIVAKHWNAVGKFLETGDNKDLVKFEGVTVGGHELETRMNAIEYLAMVQSLAYESIYEGSE